MRQLDRQIGSQLYERLTLSRNKAALLRKAADVQPGDLLTPEEAIRDPFVLEFLDIKDEYSESDLEEALIQHLADFLLELGDDFAFVGRQRRLRIDDTWFRVDLVFFHRRLRCLVIIDLKVRRFSYADAGQMHLPGVGKRCHCQRVQRFEAAGDRCKGPWDPVEAVRERQGVPGIGRQGERCARVPIGDQGWLRRRWRVRRRRIARRREIR
ncbi:MAG TPA: YhcG family protein [Steroidobacteraceae bacterium]